MENLKKIKIDEDKPIREVIVDILKDLIYKNKLKPGDRIIETTVAEKLGVSRTPIKEALRQLEVEGLVDYIPKRGTTVSEISIEDAIEMYDIREMLEGLAARLACNNMPRRIINYLKNIIDEMDSCIASEDNNKLFELSDEWNENIVQYSENKLLTKYMKSLQENLGRLRPITMVEKASQLDIVNEYKKIFVAFETGDLIYAEEATREHVRNAKKRFINRMKQSKI